MHPDDRHGNLAFACVHHYIFIFAIKIKFYLYSRFWFCRFVVPRFIFFFRTARERKIHFFYLSLFVRFLNRIPGPWAGERRREWVKNEECAAQWTQEVYFICNFFLLFSFHASLISIPLPLDAVHFILRVYFCHSTRKSTMVIHIFSGIYTYTHKKCCLEYGLLRIPKTLFEYLFP